MKKFIFYLFCFIIGIGLYLYFQKEENFKITDHIVVSQESGSTDINAPSIVAGPSYGVVKGTIKNISSKNFKDVIIIYQSGSDTIRASVGNLNKGQETEFETNRMRVNTRNPDYKVVDITFKEE
jgi:hypothetical protein